MDTRTALEGTDELEQRNSRGSEDNTQYNGTVYEPTSRLMDKDLRARQCPRRGHIQD